MLIGLGHKIKSGKDTVAAIIQSIINGRVTINDVRPDIPKPVDFEIKKFADKIKEMVCLLLGCTLIQLEDHEFKNKELGEEWWFYEYNEVISPYLGEENFPYELAKLVKPTPRLLLNLLGTDCGRKIIHPNIWVNALLNGYKINTNKQSNKTFYNESTGRYTIREHNSVPKHLWGKDITTKIFEWSYNDYPDWIITDVRFPNEAKAIKEKGGILIKIDRPFCFDSLEDYLVCHPDKKISERVAQFVGEFKGDSKDFNTHLSKMYPEEAKQFYSGSHLLESENALNDYEDWDYIIDNTGTLEELIEKVRHILVLEKII